jgi:glycosyltransferase involved in cell wall biosynthesis
MIVNAQIADQKLHSGDGEGEQRRTDFQELGIALHAKYLDWGSVDRTVLGRLLRRKFGFEPVAALLALWAGRSSDVIWCFTEVEGLLLALFYKFFRMRKILLLIAVHPLSPKSQFLMKQLRVWTHFTAILPTNTYQAAEMQRSLGVPAGKIIVLPYQVDCDYFSCGPFRHDVKSQETPIIVSAGLESRDYSTLIAAVDGLDTELFIGAASLWSGHTAAIATQLPPNVNVSSYNYRELRDLYRKASLAVVPLRESPYQDGITAIQEAMAMGLPVIVTRTTGQSDVVIDRRTVLRSNPEVETRGGFAQLLAPGRDDLCDSNGFYVPPADVTELRKCIQYLLENGSVAATLGAQGQYFVREVLSMELFVERAKRIVLAAYSGHGASLQVIQGLTAEIIR